MFVPRLERHKGALMAPCGLLESILDRPFKALTCDPPDDWEVVVLVGFIFRVMPISRNMTSLTNAGLATKVALAQLIVAFPINRVLALNTKIDIVSRGRGISVLALLAKFYPTRTTG